MKVLVSWLKDYVDINVSIDELCEKLIKIGFEVEEKLDLSRRFSNVFAGKIIDIEKHPDADKLRVCKVCVGDETLQIVTNSTTVKIDNTVPVARAGAVLANGQAIAEGRVRGVLSQGMFCGMEELGIEKTFYHSNEDGVLILGENEKAGENLIEILGLKDFILDINITANRPDCNSVYGIAREVAAALGQKCRALKTDYVVNSPMQTTDLVSVDIKNSELCPLYSMQAVTDVVIAPSPVWLARRLNLCGTRSINNIVDITNYVLLELGQPMHAFDYSDIQGKKIIVRRAMDEKLRLLDESEHNLDNDVLVIADERGAVGIAGVMGGADSGIKASTKAVVFESARFKKESIRRTSRRYGIRTESSARFEKGVDSYTPELALSRALHLISELNCGKICAGRIVCAEKAETRKSVVFPYSNVKRLLGIDIPVENILKILNNLDIKCEISNDVITCTPPDFREDIVRDCDIIEEIIRYYGYDSLVPALLGSSSCTMGGYTREQKEIEKLKDFLAANGFREIITYSFIGEADYVNSGVDSNGSIMLSNYLSEEMSLMRSTLLPSMLKTVGINFNRKNNEISLFEIGKRYKAKSLPLTDFPEEHTMLCISQSGEKASYYDLKAVVVNVLEKFNTTYSFRRSSLRFLHSGIAADIFVGDVNIGFVGQVHPKTAEYYSRDNIFICELNITLLQKICTSVVKYKKIGKYPAVTRDIAISVDDKVLAGDVLDMIRQTEFCEEAKLFDLYKGAQAGEGKKSLAFSITFRNPDRTLTDSEIDEIMLKLIEKLHCEFSAILRN